MVANVKMNKMKSNKFLLISLIAGLLTASSVYAEGNERGGSDDISYDAWFIGTTPIKYCIVMDPSTFGSTLEVAENQIAEAFKTWNEYIIKKQVNHIGSDPFRPVIDTQSIFQKNCDSTTDVTFYLGATSPEVEVAKKHYVNPLAFVEQSSYDETKGWSKGFVWVAPARSLKSLMGRGFPDWTKTNTLRGTLIHEIGHILGNGHLPGTIMRAEFKATLLTTTLYEGQSEDWTLRIDDRAELYECEQCSKTGQISKDPVEAKRVFKLFTGRDAVGTPVAIYTLDSQNTNPHQPSISLSDSIGTVALDLALNENAENKGPDYSALEINESIFSAFVLDSQGSPHGRTRHFEAGTAFYTVKDKQGNAYLSTRDFNTTSSFEAPIRIKYFEGTARKDLFIQEP